MIKEAPLRTCVCRQVGPDINPTALSRSEDHVGQTLVNSIVADANPEPYRYGRPIRGRRVEGRRCAQHATTRQRKRDRKTTGDRDDERWTGNAVDLSIDDLKTDGRTLLGGIEFAQQVDGLYRSVLDVPASRA